MFSFVKQCGPDVSGPCDDDLSMIMPSQLLCNYVSFSGQILYINKNYVFLIEHSGVKFVFHGYH